MNLYHCPLTFIILALAITLADANQSAGASRLRYPRLEYASKEKLKTSLQALIAASGGNRTTGREGARKAYAWILAEAKKIRGWELHEHTFAPDVDFAVRAYKKAFRPLEKMDRKSPEYIRGKLMTDRLIAFAEALRGKNGRNLILRKKGTNRALAKEAIIVTASYDTMTERREPRELFPDAPSPGADNNGAAVVALMAMAESLANLKPARTVELVFTDAGEAFFLGAHAYAEELYKNGIMARMIALKMIGWDGTQKNHVNLYVRSEGQPGWQGDRALGMIVGNGIAREKLDTFVERVNEERSDHYAFWASFHSATMVSQDWEYGFNDKHYRTATDTPDTVSWNFVRKIGRGVASAVHVLGLAYTRVSGYTNIYERKIKQ